MIEAKNLKKVYKTKKGVVVNALDGVSLKLPDTGMVFILGKSGSGKSTLLNVLGGLDSFDSGEIIIKGTSAAQFKQSHYDSYRNTYIGFIFQEYNILEELTVGANVALAIELQGRKATDEEINSILKEVDLDGYGARKPNELSGGQKQRVAIARALVKKPEIIMADEPTGALDSATGKQVFDTLKKLSKDKLVLIVSHDREFSEQYADRIIELKDGAVISDVEKIADNTEDEVVLEEENITYQEGEISIKKGYSLTEEDRIAINEYLAAMAKDTKITVGKGKKKKISSDAFKATDESKIVSHNKGDFKLIKSKLSLKNAFKLGSGGLKHKKVRLVFTIFLSLISFTLFGLADTIAAYDNISTATNSIRDTGINYASYIKAVKRTYSSGDAYWQDSGTYLTDADIENIKNESKTEVVGVFNKNIDLYISNIIGDLKTDGKTYENLYSKAFTGIASLDSELISKYGFSLLGENSRLPEDNADEIVITKYMYDYFNKVGIKVNTDMGLVDEEIKNVDDIIGKKIPLMLDPTGYEGIKNYTVVGVVDTGFDYSRYERLADDDEADRMNFLELMTLTSELDASRSYSFAAIAFVSPKKLENVLALSNSSSEQFEGQIMLTVVRDDSGINSEVDLWKGDAEDNFIIWPISYNRLNTIDKAKDSVKWITTPLESLEENQVIVTTSFIVDMLRSIENNVDYDTLYGTKALVGFEFEFLNKINNGVYYVPFETGLASFVRNYRTVAAYKYLSEGADINAVREEVLAYMKAGDPGFLDEWLDNYTEPDIYRIFAESVNAGESELVSEKYMSDYRSELISKYNIEQYIASESMKDLLITKVKIEGTDYYSFPRENLTFIGDITSYMDKIAGYKYVYENFQDAKAYYKQIHGASDADLEMTPVEMIVEEYLNYILYGNSQADFTPTQTVNYKDYYADILIKIYKELAEDTEGKTVMYYMSYFAGNSSMVKDIEIVGALYSGDYSSDSYIVVSDSIAQALLGENLGGVYSFAVGNMPSDTEGIKNHVKFSKTFEENGVKYILKNNVTEQLDWVDELLETLGKIFLYVGIGFAVFASLMLSNFIGTSVSYKKQEIGILRAIGSRSNDVFRIFFAEGFIIAMINYVLSIAGTLSVTMLLNKVLREDAGMIITFLNFGIRQIALLLLVSLFVAFVSTFIPVKKIASMKPIDAIKNRK